MLLLLLLACIDVAAAVSSLRLLSSWRLFPLLLKMLLLLLRYKLKLILNIGIGRNMKANININNLLCNIHITLAYYY